MVESEPRPLAEVRALAGGLEVQPRLRVELVRRARVLDLRGGVVGREQVFDDSAGFPEGDVGIGVFDGRDAAVRVDALEGILSVVSIGVFPRRVEERTFLQIGKIHELGVVGDIQLVHDDGDLPWVGALRLTVSLGVSQVQLVSRTPAWL